MTFDLRVWRALAFAWGSAAVVAIFVGISWWVPATATVVAVAVYYLLRR